MPNPNIIEAHSDHIGPVASGMRGADRREVWAFARLTPKEALRESLAMSTTAWTVMSPKTGEPFVMFGVGPLTLLSPEGVPWLLATEEVNQWRVPFARKSLRYLSLMLDEYPILSNYVDSRNRDSIAWLNWCGFTKFPAEPRGPDGVLFHKFELRRT